MDTNPMVQEALLMAELIRTLRRFDKVTSNGAIRETRRLASMVNDNYSLVMKKNISPQQLIKEGTDAAKTE